MGVPGWDMYGMEIVSMCCDMCCRVKQISIHCSQSQESQPPTTAPMILKTASGQVVPMIHLNGTSRLALLEEYRAADQAIREAISCVQAITVNGRDFHLQDLQAFKLAQAQHQQRLADLDIMLNQIDEIWNAINEQA